tara:strand:+ start:8155 stop:8829 length:675 start_codon:yes stop_codon:yes gene_type:complete
LLIAAAGSGNRMGADRNKLLLPLLGRPILSWTLKAISSADSIQWVGIVGQPIDKAAITPLLKDFQKNWVWIDGGSTRQESVKLGLAALPSNAKHILIHDGARCLVEPSLINLCAEKVAQGEAIIAATSVTDTIKKVDNKGFILETPDRSELWAAQTPQGFSVYELKEAHRKAIVNNWDVTDDASLYERLGWPVRIVEGAPSNIKVTTRIDLSIAEAIIASRHKD